MVTTPTWIYKGKIITEISDMPESTFGFIYEVTHLPTGRKYLGSWHREYINHKKKFSLSLSGLQQQYSSTSEGGH